MGNIGHGEMVFQVNYCSVPQLSEQKARGNAAHEEGILTTEAELGRRSRNCLAC